MKFNRVLLISPKVRLGKFQLALYPPAGLGYLACALTKNNISCDVFDMNLGYSFQDLQSKIRSFKPDLLAISVMTFMYLDTYKNIDSLKKLFPEIKVVVGGPHVSTFRQGMLEACKGIDFGVVLEGDEALVELCQNKPLGDIKGLIYRENDSVIFNGERDFIDNLDAVSFPRYEKFDLKHYPTTQIGLVSSRGCPFSCIFCPVSSAIGKKFRYRSPENILEELEYWNSEGHREILFLDDNFTMLPERVHKICELIRKKGLNKLSLKCPNGIRADKVDKALLKEMRESGFTMLAFGVEAGNDRILSNIKKGEKILQVEQAIKNACELGFEVELFFLIGSPGETINDVMDSFSLAKRYPVSSVKFYNLIPFPETELFRWVKHNNYFKVLPNNYLNNASHFINRPCFETPELSILERKKMFSFALTVSKGIRKKTIKRKLKRFGILADFLAPIYSSVIVQNLIFKDRKLINLKNSIKKGL